MHLTKGELLMKVTEVVHWGLACVFVCFVCFSGACDPQSPTPGQEGSTSSEQGGGSEPTSSLEGVVQEPALQEPVASEPVVSQEPAPQEPSLEPHVPPEPTPDAGTPDDAGALPEPPVVPEGPTGPPPVRQWLNVAYAGLSKAQRLDIFLPTTGNGPFPVIVWVHGGGWQGGTKTLGRNAFQRTALTRGFALVSVEYRLSGEAIFPAQIHDVKTAIRFLRAKRQTYYLDTTKIGAWGSSAGGHLVALLGTSGGVADLEGEQLGHKGISSRVQAVADWFGPTDFIKMDQHAKTSGCPGQGRHSNPNSPESKLLGADITTVPNLVKKANPINYVSTDDPPFLLQHGDKDCTVAYPQSEILRDALRSVNGAASAKYELLKGAGHSDPAFKTSANVKKVLDFFTATLKP